MNSHIDCRLSWPSEDPDSDLNEKDSEQTYGTMQVKRLLDVFFKGSHRKTTPYQCNHCRVYFSKKSNLQRHIIKITTQNAKATPPAQGNITESEKRDANSSTGKPTIQNIDEFVSKYQDECPFCGQRHYDLKKHVTDEHYDKFYAMASEQTDASEKNKNKSASESSDPEKPADVSDSDSSDDEDTLEASNEESSSIVDQTREDSSRQLVSASDAIYECTVCGMGVDQDLLMTHSESHNIKKLSFKVVTMKPPKSLFPSGKSSSLLQNPFSTKAASKQAVQDTLLSPQIELMEPCAPDSYLVIDLKKATAKIKNTLLKVKLSKRGREKMKLFKCNECSKVFKRKCFYQAHVSMHKDPSASQFQCDICSKVLSTIDSLKYHISCHGSYECNLCPRTFNNRSSLRLHKQRHSATKSFGCDVCEKKFGTKADLTRHAQTHAERQFVCDECSKAFKRRSNLLLHKKGVHGYRSKSAKYPCPECKNVYTSQQWLDLHMAKHSEENTQTKASLKKSREETTKRYQCDQCSKVFKRKTFFQAHLERHKMPATTQFQCNICDKMLATMESLKRHVTFHDDNECQLCKISFKSPSSFRKHIRRHSAVKAFMCDMCGKKFGTKQNLSDHVQTHSETKPFECDLCIKSFKRLSYLLLHKKGVHGVLSRDAKFPCQECSVVLTSQTRLEVHMRKHTGMKPLTCDKCQRAFFSSTGLQVHQSSVDCLQTRKKPPRLASRPQKDRPRDKICQICSKGFAFQSELSAHFRLRHTDERRFHCEICGRTFKTKNNLKHHTDMHMDIRPYLCSFCPKKFRRPEQLIIHIRTHTGEKPYKCRICDRGFAQITDCKKHEKIHERPNH